MTKMSFSIVILSILVGSKAMAGNPLMKAACAAAMNKGSTASKNVLGFPLLEAAERIAIGEANNLLPSEADVNTTGAVLMSLVKGPEDPNVSVLSEIIGTNSAVIRTGDPTIFISATPPSNTRFGALQFKKPGTIDLIVMRAIPSSVKEQSPIFAGRIKRNFMDNLSRSAKAPEVTEDETVKILPLNTTDRSLAIHVVRFSADTTVTTIEMALSAIRASSADHGYR